MKFFSWIKSSECYSKKNLITCIMLAISLSFTVFFFSPTETFLGNQADFIVGADIVVLPMFIVALVSSLVLALLFMFSMRSKKLYVITTSLAFGLLLSFYIQMLMFNGDVQPIGGTGQTSTATIVEYVLNFMLMYIILLLPLHITYDRDVKGKGGENKLVKAVNGKVVLYVSSVIFVMQLFGVISLYSANGLVKTGTNKYGKYLSYEPLMSVSEEENITVFLMDRLDSKWMDEILVQYPEVEKSLEGFTFYQNTVSRYNKTFPSVPCMLSYSEYEDGDWAEFLDDMWSKPTVVSKLNDNGYKVNVLFDNLTTFNNYDDLDFCNNLYDFTDDYKPNYPVVIKKMTFLSLTKLVPYYLKDLFNIYGGDLSNDFITYDEMRSDRLLPAVSPETDVRICEYFKSNEMVAETGSKTFSFIHMNSSHDISPELSEMDPNYDPSKEADVYTTTRGSLEAVLVYLDMMKKAGVYDNSTIIIMSDHGMLTDHDITSMLIKPKNAERGKLKYNIDAELSTENFYASILEYAGLDHSDYGYSFNDIIENNIHVDRYHQNFLWYGFGVALDNETIYVVRGNARDDNCWEIVG